MKEPEKWSDLPALLFLLGGIALTWLLLYGVFHLK